MTSGSSATGVVIAASSSEWHRDIGTPAPQNRPVHICQCLHAAPEWRFAGSHAAPSSAVLSRPPHDRHKCAHCPNNTQTRAPLDRNGAPKGGSACYRMQY